MIEHAVPNEAIAVTGLVKPVDHHPIIACQILEEARDLVAQALQGAGAKKVLNRLLDLRRHILRWPRPFEFDHQPAAARMMKKRGESLSGIAEMATQRDRDRVNFGAQIGPHAGPEVAAKLLEGPSQEIAGDTHEGARLCAGLNDHAILFAQKQ